MSRNRNRSARNCATETTRACVWRSAADRQQPRSTLAGLAAVTADSYVRERHLTRLVGLWPHELMDRSEAGTVAVLTLLRKAIRVERQRGRAGHWTYDLNRHIGLMGAYKAEAAHLRLLRPPNGSQTRR